MGSLSNDDLAAALELTRTAYAFDGLASFRTGILPELRRLVPADSAGYNDLDLEAGHAHVASDPSDATFAGLEEVWAATAHQHPGIISAQSGDRRPRLISDFLSVREFHRLELYGEVYQQLGTEDQIYVNLSPPTVVTIVMNRSRRSFSQRDRELIELLQPHLTQAWIQACQREHTHAVIAAQEAGLDETDTALILFDAAGTVLHASTRAHALLAAYHPGRHDAGGILPEFIADWLRASNIEVPNRLDVTTPRGQLRVRALSGQTAQGYRVLLLDERSVSIPELGTMRELGLTDRQSHVLRLLARGHNTQSIADQLYLSPATVRKHLEHIYARLGVQSRTEAVALALDQDLRALRAQLESS